MRAVVCHEGQLTVEEIDTPEPGRGQLLLKVVRTGICGSDLHARTHCDGTADATAEVGYEQFMRSSQHVVMGHEFIGEVVSYGPKCRRRWPTGTLVASMPIIKHGDTEHLTGFSEAAPGAYAEYVVVAEDVTLPVPEGVSIDEAALTEPLSVATHAVARSEVGKRDVAVVIGCGPIGLGVILVLKARGVKTVIASDLSAGRRELARQCGADIVVDPKVDSPFDLAAAKGKYLTRTGDLLGLAFTAMHQLQRIPRFPWWRALAFADKIGATPRGPVVFECVGVPGMIEQIANQTPLRSRVVVVGVCMQRDAFRPVMAINKELDLRFVIYYDPAEFRSALHLIASGKVNVAAMITGTVGLDGVAQVFETLGGAEHHAKVLVDPSSAVSSL
ncbi:MAG: zinc-binding dehydrogenase [Gordonia sp. (in: high G+C Gram-positive bacteria)]